MKKQNSFKQISPWLSLMNMAGKSIRIFYVCVLFLCMETVYSQPRSAANQQPPPQETKEISGQVFDEKGEPLPGVTVLVEGIRRGVMTDRDGKFALSVPVKSERIFFTFVGFTSREVQMKNKKVFTIRMQPQDEILDEVVVTGIFKKDISTFTGAATTITAAELEELGNTNIITKISLLDPSVHIVENNEQGSNPNSLPSIEIRGNSSIPNITELDDPLKLQEDFKEDVRARLNTPLIIFDGFEISLEQLYDLNEDDVESVTILKDASATAIYGSRGGNGVIVVTTKRPAMGKLTLSYTGSLNIQAPDLTSYNMMNAKDKLDLEVLTGLRGSDDIDALTDYNNTLNAVNSGVNTYWLSQPLRKGVGQRHNLRISGGDRSFRYTASLRYNNTIGVMLKSLRETFNGGLTISYYKNNVRLTNSVNVTQTNSSNTPYGSFSSYVNMNPYFRPYDDEGKLIRNWREYYKGSPKNIANPLYNGQLNTYNEQDQLNISNNLSVEVILGGLTLRGSLGVSTGVKESDDFKPADHTVFSGGEYITDEGLFRKGSYNYSTGKFLGYDASLNASYSKTFNKKHTLYSGLNLSLRESGGENYAFKAEGFNHEDFDFFPMAMSYRKGSKPSGNESKSRSVGVAANLNYSYSQRYFVDASFRMDGSSQFGSEHRFAPFWSAGFGWNVHNEDYIKAMKFISQLRLRFSTGVSGTQKFTSYQALSTYKYSTGERYWYWFGANMMALGNPNLKWQEVFSNNLGIDASFLKKRFSVGLNIYKSTTKGLISSIEIPLANGFSSYVENVGEMENQGIDVKLSAVVLRKKGFVWRVSGNGAKNRNKIVKLSPAFLEAQEGIAKSLGKPVTTFVPGHSTNTLWVVRSLGIDPSTGQEVFLSKSGEQVNKWNGADIIDYGTTDPKLRGSLNTSFSYKRLSIGLTGSYIWDARKYNSTLAQKVESSNYMNNVDQRVYDYRWKKPGDIVAFKGLNNTSSSYKSTRFVQEENTFSIRNVRVSYRVSKAQIKKWTGISKMSGISLSFNTSDLLYISTVKRERGTGYPYARMFSFSLNTTF